MEIKINVDNLNDVRLLSACINQVQQKIIHEDMNYTIASLKIEGAPVEKAYKEWQEETLKEWYSMQKIKQQLDNIIIKGV